MGTLIHQGRHTGCNVPGMSPRDNDLTVALPVLRGRVAPLFDAAKRVLVVEITRGEEHSRRVVDLPDGGWQDRLSALRTLGVDALVCGAISNRSLSEALHLGLQVWSAVAGTAEQVIGSLVSTGGVGLALAMPVASTSHFCGDLAWVGGDGPLIWGWRVGTTRKARMSCIG